jgi:hypothetical protein
MNGIMANHYTVVLGAPESLDTLNKTFISLADFSDPQ